MKAWRERRAEAALRALAGDTWREVGVDHLQMSPRSRSRVVAIHVSASRDCMVSVAIDGREMMAVPAGGLPVRYEFQQGHPFSPRSVIRAFADGPARVAVEIA